MKRSFINRQIIDAIDFFARHHFHLPPFAFWTSEQWRHAGPEADEIRTRMLGWDVTDFGSGDFAKIGLTLFTLRNGRQNDPDNHKTYAEKILIVHENQVTPWHFHFQKTEDIINRGGGRLGCALHNATPDGRFAHTPVRVSVDGVVGAVKPGGTVILQPGESITLVPGLYHEFHAQIGHGTALIGEVSSINDDTTDNRFFETRPRYLTIEEDVPPLHLLCNEYPRV